MNHIEATQYIKATLTAFGPDEASSMTKETWAKLHEAMKALAEQPAQPQEPTQIGRPHRAVMGDYGAKLVNQRIEMAVDAERKMQAKTAETRVDSGFGGGGRQQIAQQEPTESVLVDGVAYVIPAAVAYELLHLHLQIEASRTEKQEPLTDEQCDAIYTALDEWAKEFDPYEFGLPSHCGDGMVGGRSIIRKAAHGITKGGAA